jgi:hypothetical protein
MEKYKSDYKKPKWTFNFYKNYRFVLIPEKRIVKEVLWKDKFDSPRCEISPYIRIEWLWFGFYAVQGDDEQWEQWLWVHMYYDGDVDKAKKEWCWIDGQTKKTTWDDTFGK